MPLTRKIFSVFTIDFERRKIKLVVVTFSCMTHDSCHLTDYAMKQSCIGAQLFTRAF